MNDKVSTPRLARLASEVLKDDAATPRERSLAASVLAQAERRAAVDKAVEGVLAIKAPGSEALRELRAARAEELEPPAPVGDWCTLVVHIKPDSRLGAVDESSLTTTLLREFGSGDAMIAGMQLVKGVHRGS